ncbi:helix-turn-helix domain-containing protein [Streptomyces chryseus]|uniref:helix-turn-helix domain-containing protein n=1 Tax=Streptomyces chryseus TaxID=68186 RepID=UPI00110FD6B1|nr:helix-turn-helix transcriptional regulator [Streptomyces chryseus]GGX02276.1 hypothetical protein GCM10010353_17500 [Streptomyces chryseus]
MNPATPQGATRAQRLAAVVAPAAKRAGYHGYGAGARLARDTGMSESSVSRLLKGQAVPDSEFWEPLARAIDMSLRDLMVDGGLISPESLQALSETDRSQVRSRSITPAEAADGLGFTDPVAREMFYGTIERLKRLQDDTPATEDTDESGGAQARM